MTQRKLMTHPDKNNSPAYTLWESWEFDTVADCTATAVPFHTTSTYLYTGMIIDWGDGEVTTVADHTDYAHTYAEAGQYHISIYYPDWENVNYYSNITNPSSDTYLQVTKTTISKVYKLPKFKNTTLDRLFARWSALEEVAEDLFDNYTTVSSMTYIFYYCTSLKTIPKNLFSKLTALTTLTYGFQYSGLEEIPEGLFDNCTSLRYITYLFNASNITSIPEDLFINQTAITDFQSVFASCKNLTSIPVGLFRNQINATTFRTTFYNCGFTEIPENLFINNTAVTSFYQTFSSCANLISIPSGLFKYNTAVTDFTYVFSGCSSITEIPEGLFENNTEVTTFRRAFGTCYDLASVPDNLFSNCTKVTTFELLFYFCTDLTEVPETLFSNCPEVTSFNSTFMYCTKLESIPKNLFANNTKVTDFTDVFARCSSITEIPEGLFDNCTEVTTFEAAFYACNNNLIVPKNIFANQTKVTDLGSAFGNYSVANNTVCPNSDDEYVSFVINSEVVSTFSSSSRAFTGNNGKVYLEGVVEESTTATAVEDHNLLGTTCTLVVLDSETNPCSTVELSGTAWEFDTIEGCTTVGVPINTSVAYTGMQIDWGDGSITTVESVSDYLHTYSTAGKYHISVYYNDWENVALSSSNNSTTSPIIEARVSITKIYKIPSVANTSFYSLFANYTALTEIESDLFNNNTNVTLFNRTFYGCTSLTSLPSGLFNNNTVVTYFNYIFQNCSSLTSIPTDLFINNTRCVDFGFAFQNCSSLTNQTVYIGSTVVTSAHYFMSNTGSNNRVYIPANSNTYSTFSLATGVGCTIATY